MCLTAAELHKYLDIRGLSDTTKTRLQSDLLRLFLDLLSSLAGGAQYVSCLGEIKMPDMWEETAVDAINFPK